VGQLLEQAGITGVEDGAVAHDPELIHGKRNPRRHLESRIEST